MTTQPSDKLGQDITVDTSPEFQRNIKTLKKRYRNISKDIGSVIEQIQVGELPGDQITGTGFVIYKVRVKNQDIRKGKSAGYRIIYQVESKSSVVLLRIYSKSDTDEITTPEILEVISRLGRDYTSE